jgi:hypothetical protein
MAIVAKVKKIRRYAGNLAVLCEFYDGERLIGEEEMTVPENGLEKAILQEDINHHIGKLEEQLPAFSLQVGEEFTKKAKKVVK